MKKNIFLAAIISLFVFGANASAQKAANFSGTWSLDVSKSKLGDRNSIESQTLTVVQTDKDVKITTSTKRMAPPAAAAGAAPAGAPGGGGRPGGGGGMGGDQTVTYTLDGKETVVEMEMGGNKIPVKYTGKLDGGKLNIGSSRTFTGPNGEVTSTSKESWSLSADGNTLTVEAESVSPRGTTNTTKVFTKKA